MWNRANREPNRPEPSLKPEPPNRTAETETVTEPNRTVCLLHKGIVRQATLLANKLGGCLTSLTSAAAIAGAPVAASVKPCIPLQHAAKRNRAVDNCCRTAHSRSTHPSPPQETKRVDSGVSRQTHTHTHNTHTHTHTHTKKKNV